MECKFPTILSVKKSSTKAVKTIKINGSKYYTEQHGTIQSQEKTGRFADLYRVTKVASSNFGCGNGTE
ncbi:hypothetical protein NUACC21_40870 [Scytonema sp. NUACC21]